MQSSHNVTSKIAKATILSNSGLRNSMNLANSGRLHRHMQFVLGLAQMVLRLNAVAVHIIVVGCTSPFHLMNRFQNMLMDIVKIVPVPNLSGKHRASNEG